jgi:hypothetical protein
VVELSKSIFKNKPGCNRMAGGMRSAKSHRRNPNTPTTTNFSFSFRFPVVEPKGRACVG